MEKTNITAIIYARVSTCSQDYERQLNDLREYANRMDYVVVKEFAEKILSYLWDDVAKINPEDYFEMGFLICNNTKTIKRADGCMKQTMQALLSNSPSLGTHQKEK